MGRRYRSKEDSSLGIRLLLIIVILAAFWLNSNKDYVIYVWIGAGLLLTLGAIMFILYIKKRGISAEFNNEITNDSDDVSSSVKTRESNRYYRKNLMTEAEKCFYSVLTEITGSDFIIQPQINLATIIRKESKEPFQSELYRNIDFGIFKKNNYELLLLIELNDKTHHTPKRNKRDIGVNNLCKEARIPLVTFWLNMPNTQEYISNRITPFLKIDNFVCEQEVKNNIEVPSY